MKLRAPFMRCLWFTHLARLRRPRLVTVALVAVSSLLAACDGAAATPDPTATIRRPVITPTPRVQPVVEVIYEVSPEIVVGAEASLIFGITNVGDVAINDLDIAIDAIFMSNFVPGLTVPRARIGELPQHLHFLYGAMEPGETQNLLIRLLSVDIGSFPMTVQIMDLGRAGTLLVDPEGTPWVIEETITVVPPAEG